ncbi:MAG: hypothetical protein NTW47_18740 [Proteobacteria bacterium]|nr:hypothetical protein [Pseudomonadota bacterium]
MKERGATIRRALRTKEFREQQLRYEASGKSVMAFCRGEGVAESTFYQRRARLKGGKRAAPWLDPTAGGKQRTGFIDAGPMVIAAPGDHAVRAQRETSGEQVSGVEVRLELGDGLVLYVRRT